MPIKLKDTPRLVGSLIDQMEGWMNNFCMYVCMYVRIVWMLNCMDMFVGVRWLLETIYFGFSHEVSARTQRPCIRFFLRRWPFGEDQDIIVHKVQLFLPT